MATVYVDHCEVIGDCSAREVGDCIRDRSDLPRIFKTIGENRVREAMAKMHDEKSKMKDDDETDVDEQLESELRHWSTFYKGAELWEKAFREVFKRRPNY